MAALNQNGWPLSIQNGRPDWAGIRIVTTDPNDTLEKVLGNAKVPENDSTERGIILLWSKQKRIITHFDVLKRLFQGVLPPTPKHNRRAPGL